MPLRTSRAAAALALLALAVPAAPAVAKPGGNGKGKGNAHGQAVAAAAKAKAKSKPRRAKPGKGPKTQTVVVQGTVVSAWVDELVVTATGGNKAARRAGLTTGERTFALTGATFTVADANGDGVASADDLAPGDAVVVQVKLPAGPVADGPLTARVVSPAAA